MATTLTLKRYVAHADGRQEMVFGSSVSGETGRIWGSMDAMREELTLLEQEDQAIRYFLAYWLARDDDLSNPNLMLNKSFTVDFGAPNPIRLQ